MKEKFYGNFVQCQSNSIDELHIEEIKNFGYTIIESALDKKSVDIYRSKIDTK